MTNVTVKDKGDTNAPHLRMKSSNSKKESSKKLHNFFNYIKKVKSEKKKTKTEQNENESDSTVRHAHKLAINSKVESITKN